MLGVWGTPSLNVTGAREAVREVGTGREVEAGGNSVLNLKAGMECSNEFATVELSREGVRGSPAPTADAGEAPTGDQGRTEGLEDEELRFQIVSVDDCTQSLDILAAMNQFPIRLLMPRPQEAPVQVPSSIFMDGQ
jgi:hypothetical protein